MARMLNLHLGEIKGPFVRRTLFSHKGSSIPIGPLSEEVFSGPGSRGIRTKHALDEKKEKVIKKKLKKRDVFTLVIVFLYVNSRIVRHLLIRKVLVE